MASLDITGVDKRYGGVQALKGASLSVAEGEVHGLLGPNGSGKSTLNKVMAGAVRPDAATIRLDGQDLRIHGPQDAHHHRIESVYQQLSLIPHLTVAENLVLGTEAARAGWLTPKAQLVEVDAMLERLSPVLGGGIGPRTRVGSLNPGTKQLLEFAKVVLRRPRFLVLDEATASLHRDQVALLFAMVRELTAEGVGVVFVSHRMEEVLDLCDRATIIRNGLNVATVDVKDTDEQELVRLMVGDLARAAGRGERPAPSRDGQPVLSVRGLQAEGLADVSLDVHPGEIVGLGGLQGQGQSELLTGIFGASPAQAERIEVAGDPVEFRNPRSAIAAGLALVPGDRASEGLYSVRSIQENISTVTLGRRARAGLVIDARAEKEAATSQVDALRIKIGALADAVSTLSGGNAQKVVVAKWLLSEPRIVLLDDPTKGVDVGAKAEIYAIIRDLTAQGVGVILNSSDDVELAELADRVLVLYEGRIVQELEGTDVTHDNLVAAALRISDDDTKES
ncbi:sugar ABC transporter ATP-binding protein [Demequina soli]|uniref:sugar ABC transporter ATP-binding protein n=1 Tax=Demequina soli TaxID=1638987 RepID=UPI0007855574|nr:sugar ABC transporter ATP-binding protein [Demequina soli]